MDALQNWLNFVVNIILGGELNCMHAIPCHIVLTKRYASHHDPSVTCHVSAIQADTYFSHHNRLGCYNRLWSSHRKSKQLYHRG
jgi:hypothetical protein